jgi:hypothetical protein
LNSYTKEAQLKHHNDRKAAKAERTKGQRQEKEVAKALGGRQNNQRGAGGGISQPDISFGRFNIESKSGETEQIRAALTHIESETPPNRRPGLVFIHNKAQWIAIKLDHHIEFAADVIEREGGEVIF